MFACLREALILDFGLRIWQSEDLMFKLLQIPSTNHEDKYLEFGFCDLVFNELFESIYYPFSFNFF
jgi:hypothetical protein